MRDVMPTQDSDISWSVLRQIVHDWAGSSAELDEVKLLDGGSVATTVALHTKAGDRAVLKITQHRIDRAYADEAHQLKMLRDIGLPTPEVYRYSIGTLDHPFSYLLMEFRDGVDLARVKAQCSTEEFDHIQAQLAGVVRHLHSHRNEHYCRVASPDAPVAPKQFDAWGKLFRDVYDPIWTEAQKSTHLPTKCRKTVSKIHERLPQLLPHHSQPQLLHGDLWSANVLVIKTNEGAWKINAILDPLCRYGDIECELAYLELFHTVTPTFLRTYLGDKHLPTEYHRIRKPIYHLYEMLNHLQLFGPEYSKATVEAVEKVAALV